MKACYNMLLKKFYNEQPLVDDPVVVSSSRAGQERGIEGETQFLVSIIINNYNYGRYLAEAVDSALNQDYPFVEVIVVDDGSTDMSRDIIRSYGNRVTAIFKQNGGQGTCFNIGFERCRGDIVIFLDSDDYLFPTAAALIAKRMADPAISKCNGYLQVVDGDGKPTGGRLPHKLSPTGSYSDAVLKYGPWAYVSCFTSGNAWSRKFLSQVMPIPTENRAQGSDGYLTAIDALYGNIETIDEFIGGYRIHGSNNFPTTHQFTPEKLAVLLQSEEERGHYVVEHAKKLGLVAEHHEWNRRSSWLLLIRYALSLMDCSAEAPKLLEHLASPFRKETRSALSRLKVFIAIVVIRLSPKNVALELSRRVLRFPPESD